MTAIFYILLIATYFTAPSAFTHDGAFLDPNCKIAIPSDFSIYAEAEKILRNKGYEPYVLEKNGRITDGLLLQTALECSTSWGRKTCKHGVWVDRFRSGGGGMLGHAHWDEKLNVALTHLRECQSAAQGAKNPNEQKKTLVEETKTSESNTSTQTKPGI